MFKIIKLLIVCAVGYVVLTALPGCEEQVRYPCQDPANWDKDICKPPICEVNRQCPELIFKDNKKLATTPPQTPAVAPKKGECK